MGDSYIIFKQNQIQTIYSHSRCNTSCNTTYKVLTPSYRNYKKSLSRCKINLAEFWTDPYSGRRIATNILVDYHKIKKDQTQFHDGFKGQDKHAQNNVFLLT